MNIIIRRFAPDGLSVQEWNFHNPMGDLTFVVGSYKVERRASKRHKFARTGIYERALLRDSTIQSVPLPADVVAEVEQAIISSIKVSV